MKDETEKEMKITKAFFDSLKYAFDECIERDKEWSEINQVALKKEKGAKGQDE